MHCSTSIAITITPYPFRMVFETQTNAAASIVYGRAHMEQCNFILTPFYPSPAYPIALKLRAVQKRTQRKELGHPDTLVRKVHALAPDVKNCLP